MNGNWPEKCAAPRGRQAEADLSSPVEWFSPFLSTPLVKNQSRPEPVRHSPVPELPPKREALATVAPRLHPQVPVFVLFRLLPSRGWDPAACPATRRLEHLLQTPPISQGRPQPSGEQSAEQGRPDTMESKDLTQRLPEDVLVAVLRRLPPHALAAARCVCKAWHAAIDARRLLDLYPPSLAGLFINFFDLDISELFLRPLRRGTDTPVSGNLCYVPTADGTGVVVDHCNGLVLLRSAAASYVVNPATRSWAPLPPPPPRLEHGRCYLVFDPAVSPHYEVVRIPSLPWRTTGFEPQLEWPPSPFVVDVFSSTTGCWEERSLARRGDAIGTVAHLQQLEKRSPVVPQLSAHWRGDLYVFNLFVMRISLSNNTYQAIEPPVDVGARDQEFRLGRSENGVYFASFGPHCRLQVWILNELHGEIEWVLEHDNNLDLMLSCGRYDPQVQGPWVIEDINYNSNYSICPIDMKEEVEEDGFEWNSDNENTLDTGRRFGNHYNGGISILGFHPYREVIFLNASFTRGLAYHLNSSKLEDLGSIYPKDYSSMQMFIEQSFPYTPCWIGKLPGST